MVEKEVRHVTYNGIFRVIVYQSFLNHQKYNNQDDRMGIELLIFTGRKGPGGLQSSNKGRKRERLSGAGDKIKWIDIGLKTGQFVRFWKVEGKTLYR